MSRRAVQFAKKFVNRNPLNAHLSGLQPIPSGFELDADAKRRHFLYRAELSQSGAHQEATVTHFTDGVVLRVSTREPSISSQLHSTADTAAALNLGRVLATKALKAGILRVAAVDEATKAQSLHQKHFYKALEETGLTLGEMQAPEVDYALDKRITWKRFPIHHNRSDKIDDDDAARERN
ncbi:unnamed protein product, partial [Mesorhabditis spiculigera]